MDTSLAIVIVNWNAGRQLLECLESIRTARIEGFQVRRVVVVDNDSSDQSLERIKELDLPLKLICNKANRGFAAACNQGAVACDAEYLLFLNPDTRLYSDSLLVPISFMNRERNEDVGICGIQLINEGGSIARSCARFPTPRLFCNVALGLNRISPGQFSAHIMAEWDHCTSGRVDHVIGAFYLVRTRAFRQLGGFDERFFVYLEDLDFSYRAYQMGWRSYYLADVKAYHKGGGTSENIKAVRLFYSRRSRILYALKHFNGWGASAVMVCTLAFELPIRLGGCLISGAWARIPETAHGYWLLWQAVPGIVRVHLRERCS